MPAPQQPFDLDPTPESVVEFGSPPAESRRRWNIPGLPPGLATDRRLVPITAGLAAVAAFASLVSEWQVTTVDRALLGGEGGEIVIPTDASDLGALGTGYLVGIFGVVAAVVLTLFGPAAARRYTRLTGLSVASTMLGLVLALAVSLGEQSRIISRLYTLDTAEDQVQVAYGRGLWCALAAVLFALLALHLSGRPMGAPAAPETDEEPIDEEPAAVWSWRRPPDADDDDRSGPEPLELTVSRAKPFTSLSADDRDKPSRS
ncbi:MAG: hypothetical protein ABW022_13705 [Actinoplanes sp.]